MPIMQKSETVQLSPRINRSIQHLLIYEKNEFDEFYSLCKYPAMLWINLNGIYFSRGFHVSADRRILLAVI